MLKANPELLLSEIKRMQRLHKREDLPDILTDYITDRYYPKTMATTRSRKKKPGPSFELIRDKVVKHYGADWEILVSRTRKKEVVAIRRVMFYILAVRTKFSMKTIGGYFNRDHTTVIHNRDRLMELMESDNDLRKEVEFLNSQI